MASMEDLVATINGGMHVGQQGADLKDLHVSDVVHLSLDVVSTPFSPIPYQALLSLCFDVRRSSLKPFIPPSLSTDPSLLKQQPICLPTDPYLRHPLLHHGTMRSLSLKASSKALLQTNGVVHIDKTGIRRQGREKRVFRYRLLDKVEALAGRMYRAEVLGRDRITRRFCRCERVRRRWVGLGMMRSSLCGRKMGTRAGMGSGRGKGGSVASGSVSFHEQ